MIVYNKITNPDKVKKATFYRRDFVRNKTIDTKTELPYISSIS